MEILFYILLFVFGTVMGSFAGVIIERGRDELSWDKLAETFGGRSYCPSCKKTLKVRQLIPLGGRLLQRGRCYYCKKEIPAWYPMIELAMGTTFVLTFVLLFTGVEDRLLEVTAGNMYTLWITFARLGFNWAMVSLIAADLLWYELNIFMRILSLLIGIELLAAHADMALVVSGLLNGAILTAVYFAIYLFGRRWVRMKTGEPGEGMGQGDVLLAFVLGLVSVLWPYYDVVSYVQLVCWFLVISSLLGAIYRIIRVVISGDRNQMLPFIPAMIVGWYVIMMRGTWLIELFMI